MKKVLVSYVPLLDYSKFIPGDYYKIDNIADTLEEHVNSLNTKHPIGIGWAYNDDDDDIKVGVIYCFDGEHYKDFAGHLQSWLEGDNDRMVLCIEVKDDHYSVMLYPDPGKAITRWKAARLMNFEEAVDDGDFEIVAVPIYCASGSFDNFNMMKDRIGDKIMVGFADYKDLENTIWVGGFKCEMR